MQYFFNQPVLVFLDWEKYLPIFIPDFSCLINCLTVGVCIVAVRYILLCVHFSIQTYYVLFSYTYLVYYYIVV